MSSMPQQARHTPKQHPLTVDLCAMIRNDMRDINSELRSSDAASVEQERGFRKAFENEITESLSQTNETWNKSTAIDSKTSTSTTSDKSAAKHAFKSQPVFVEADNIFGECHNLIAHYDHLCHVTDSEPSNTDVGAKWQQDYEAMAELLGIGRRVALHQLHQVIGTHRFEMGEMPELSNEDRKKASALLGMGMGSLDQDDGDSMGDILAKVEKGVKSLTKSLQHG